MRHVWGRRKKKRQQRRREKKEKEDWQPRSIESGVDNLYITVSYTAVGRYQQQVHLLIELELYQVTTV